MSTEQFIRTFPLVVEGLAAIAGLISFRRNYPDTLKKMCLLCIFIFFVDLAGHITRYLDIKNHWIYNINFWVLYLSLAWLYRRQIQSKYIRAVIRVFYIVFPLLIVIESLLVGIKDLQTAIIVAGGTFSIFLSAAYFRQLYMSEESGQISRDPWFWFSFGFIIYFGGIVPFLGMLNYLLIHYPLFTRFYYFYFSNSFTTLLNIFIIAGFLCRKKK